MNKLLGKIYQRLRNHDEALNYFTKSLELDSNCAYSLFRRAWTFKSKAKFVEAGIDFELARNLRINDPNFSIEYKKISKLEYIEIDSEPDFVYPFPTLLPLV